MKVINLQKALADLSFDWVTVLSILRKCMVNHLGMKHACVKLTCKYFSQNKPKILHKHTYG